MDFVKALLSSCRQRTPVSPPLPRPNALEESHLRKLPTELLQYIASSLPPVSAALFSLSCRRIYLEVGNQHLVGLATSNHDTIAVLNRIADDLLDHIVCNHCKKLHSMKHVRRYLKGASGIWTVPKPECNTHDRDALVGLIIYPNFSSAVFKILMKHYLQFGYDRQTRELLKHMSSDPLDNTGYFRYRNLNRHEEAECRIRGDSLFIQKRITFRGTCTDLERSVIDDQICHHIDCRSDRGQNRLVIQDDKSWGMERSSASVYHQKYATFWSIGRSLRPCRFPEAELEQCLRCRTEYKISVEHEEGCNMIIKVDIWKNLGPGPESAVWEDHINTKSNEAMRVIVGSTRVIGAGIASIFENKDLAE